MSSCWHGTRQWPCFHGCGPYWHVAEFLPCKPRDKRFKMGANVSRVVLIVLVVVVVVAIVVAVVVPPLLGCIGFAASGPVAGSMAAGWMSSSAIASGGAVQAGSLVAMAQSAAMGGAALAKAAAVGAAVAGVGAGVAAAVWNARRRGPAAKSGKGNRPFPTAFAKGSSFAGGSDHAGAPPPRSRATATGAGDADVARGSVLRSAKGTGAKGRRPFVAPAVGARQYRQAGSH